jgi:hypothetical protein
LALKTDVSLKITGHKIIIGLLFNLFLNPVPTQNTNQNTEVTSDFNGNEDRFLADLAFALAAIGREMYAEEQAAKAGKGEVKP